MGKLICIKYLRPAVLNVDIDRHASLKIEK